VAGDALLDLGEVLPQAAFAHHRAHPVPPLRLEPLAAQALDPVLSEQLHRRS
jgi:hypothetical protein